MADRGILMQCVNIKDLSPGLRVGREVMSGEGLVLLEKGTRLTAQQIASLQVWNIPVIYVDEATAVATDNPEGSLSRVAFLNEYAKTIEAVRESFENIRQFKDVPVLQLKELVDQSIIVLVNTVGALYYLYEVRSHNDYTFQHSVNVAVVSGILAKWLDYDKEDRQKVMLSGLLHDIGKLFIPLPILDKPSKLNYFEYEEIKKHPQEGHRLLEYSEQLPRDVKLGILQHHERVDGSGYPFGFKGDEIHEFAKIVAVADMYDAMTSDRTYRKRFTPLGAAEEITSEMYNKLDTAACLKFLYNMQAYFTGNTVVLSSGQKAKIVFIDSKNWSKPIVQTEDGTLLDLKIDKVSIVDFIQE
jgi:putative nucleotidyltransferase with HDIG domain